MNGVGMDTLTVFLSELDVPNPEIISATIRRRFTVIDRDGVPKGEPEVGHVWRNRLSSRLVRVDEIRHDPRTPQYDRVAWVALSGLGPRIGETDRQSWRTRFEFVAENEVGL